MKNGIGELRKISEPGLDPEKPNAIGWLDKLVTNFAISAIAVIPTFLTCIVRPWRLTELLDRDDPDGRMGMLLAPGVFFLLALMVSFMTAAVLATPETLSTNGSFIGPGLAVSVQSAASDGDIWKIIAIIMPIYGTAVLMGLLGMCLKPWAHQNWTLRVSLRAAFYVTAVVISWMILTTAAIDLIRLYTGNFEIGSLIFSILIIPTCVFIIRTYYWFFRNDVSVSWVRGGALSLAMFGLVAALMWVTDFIIRL